VGKAGKLLEKVAAAGKAAVEEAAKQSAERPAASGETDKTPTPEDAPRP